ncbi:MAG: sensor histidine kinase [Bacilli bacterium]|jgi:two-component system phosphate regulon sensor histidine kinase PhoR
MKKKLILINILIVSISLSVLLILSAIIINKLNSDDVNYRATNYLNLATSIYDGSNEEELLERITTVDENIRLTIIDTEGKVILDSSLDNIEESHLTREEILNLGKICIRYSSSLKREMLYIAAFDDGNYVRISFPTNEINKLIDTYITAGIIILLVLVALSTYLISLTTKKYLIPVNQKLTELVKIADRETGIGSVDVDALPAIIELIKDNIDEKIMKISNEKSKLLDVINTINKPILVVDSNKRIQLFNNDFIRIMKLTEKGTINKNYLYAIRDKKLQNVIDDCLSKNEDNKIQIKINDQVYLVNIEFTNKTWLKNGVIIIFDDITEQIMLEQTKKDFFANASHELKSPLTSIIGYQQMITEGIVQEPEEIIECSKKSIKEANRMNDIVIDMLSLSKIEHKEPVNFELLNIKSIVLELLEIYKNKLEEKTIKVNLDLEDNYINIDKKYADELIRNLIDNAIKYNKLNGQIDIKLTKNSFVIKDTGVGMSEEDRKHIFERFYRVDKAKSKALGGTGLGLAIVKHICERHDFNISVKSKINEGSEFTIDFVKTKTSK